MNNFNIEKKLAKKKNREATIKHYILGYILECIVKEDINVTRAVRILLIHNLKIITEETFIYCLRKARINRLLRVNGTKKNYSEFKKHIELVDYEYEKQVEIIKQLQEFANNFENGIFINTDMGKSSYENVKSYI